MKKNYIKIKFNQIKVLMPNKKIAENLTKTEL